MKFSNRVMILIGCISLALFWKATLAYSLQIQQLNYQQIPKNSQLDITLSVDSGSALWKKVLGPEWVSINSSTGRITGTTNNIGEAHYVQVKAIANNEAALMTFILIVGNQRVFVMDGSINNPSTISDSYDMMSGGDVLIIPDGVYTGDINTYNGNAAPKIKNGSAANYTTWIAEHPGRSTLPSIYARGCEYVAFKGLEIAASAGYVGFTASGLERFGVVANHIKIILCHTMAGGFQAISSAQYVLFEDCFAYGNSRSVFRVGSTNSASQYIVFRRCVARHDFTTSSNPTAAFMQYGGDNVLYQNCLNIDQSENDANFASAYARYGAWETKNGANIFVKDSMAINIVDEFHFGDTNTDNVRFSNCLFWGVGTGSTTRSANTIYDNLTVGDVNAQDSGNTFSDRSSSNTVYFTDSIFYDIQGTGTETGFRSRTILYDLNESFNNLFYPIQSDINIGDSTDIITGIDALDGVPGNGNSGIKYIVRTEAGSDVKNRELGANILWRRGASGSLWGEPGYDSLMSDSLWPWPNEEMIQEKMGTYNYTSGSINVTGRRGFCANNQTLTKYIWEYLGNPIPSDIYIESLPQTMGKPDKVWYIH